MAVGFGLHTYAVGVVEDGVLASVVVLGALTAANRPGEFGGLAVVAGAGVLHGMAHAADVGQAGPLFELGMLTSTAALHAIGLCAGLALGRAARPGLVRWAGAAVAAGGVVLAVAG
jgi:urease accessory protein